LGFTISAEGAKMERDKLSTVIDWPYPRHLKEPNRFLAYLNFYRKFISRFSTVTAPLTRLTKSGVNVELDLRSAKCQESFQALKNSFTTAPLLQHFDFQKPRVLHVDSSKYALSAVLSQVDDKGRLKPVFFLSRKWTERQSSWQVHDQELGAIVEAFVEWRAWLINTREEVVVFSDHANLRYFMLSQNLSDRQARWAAYLTSFNFVIRHIAGKLNPADPPTRRPDFLPDGKDSEEHSRLFQESMSGWKLRDSSLDIADGRIDIAEVIFPPTAPVKKPDIDIFFCAPSKELKALLLKA
jgi:hypothetical protein